MPTSSRPTRKGRLYSGRRPVLFCGLGLTVLLIIYFFYQPGLLDTANNRIYDTLLVSIPPAAPSSLPVIIDIDDESLNRFGQWPWPRYRVARLLELIKVLGARSIALDMVFPEPDRTSLDHLQSQIEHDFKIRLDLSNVPENLTDNDAFLSENLIKADRLCSDINSPLIRGLPILPVADFILLRFSSSDENHGR